MACQHCTGGNAKTAVQNRGDEDTSLYQLGLLGEFGVLCATCHDMKTAEVDEFVRPVRCHTRGYLPNRRASPPFDRCQIIIAL